jgi:hypothetical protein
VRKKMLRCPDVWARAVSEAREKKMGTGSGEVSGPQAAGLALALLGWFVPGRPRGCLSLFFFVLVLFLFSVFLISFTDFA